MLDVGYNEARIGLIAGAASLAAVGVRPGIGRLIDRYSRRLVIRIGTGVLAIVAVGYGLVSEAGAFLVSVRVVQGLADAMTYTAFFAYVVDRVPAERRTQGMALFGISGLAPIGLGTALGDFVLSVASYQWLFFVAAGFSLVAFGLSLTLPGGREVIDAPPRGFFHALTNRQLVPVWLAAGLVGLAFSVVFVYVKTFVETRGLGSVAPFFLAYAGIAVLLRLAFGWVPDRFGLKRSFGPGLASYVLAYVVLAFTTTSTGLMIAGLLAGAGHSMAFPITFSLASQRSGPEIRGAVTAVFMAVIDAAAIVFTPIVGGLITGYGYLSAFAATAAVLVVGLVTFYRLDSQKTASSSIATV